MIRVCDSVAIIKCAPRFLHVAHNSVISPVSS